MQVKQHERACAASRNLAVNPEIDARKETMEHHHWI